MRLGEVRFVMREHSQTPVSYQPNFCTNSYIRHKWVELAIRMFSPPFLPRVAMLARYMPS